MSKKDFNINSLKNTLSQSSSFREALEKIELSERALQRIFKKNGLKPPSWFVGKKEEIVEQDGDYVYNRDTDTYVVNIRGLAHPILMSGTQHKNIIRQYSNSNGDPSTVNEISRTFGLPRRHVIKYLRVFGITHDSLPFSQEEMDEKTDEELLEDARVARQRVLFEKIEKDKWKEEKKDAAKWRAWKQNTLDVITKEINDNLPNYVIPFVKATKQDKKFSLVINLQDLHFGKGSSAYDVGEKNKFSLELCKNRVLESVENLISMVLSYGNPEKVYIVAGGDAINADNFQNTTTEGTPQDNEVSVTTAMWTAKRTYADVVNMLRQITKNVEIVPLPGNHDRILAIELADWLYAWFRNDTDVICNMSGESRQYRKYGQTVLGFSHGDKLKPERTPIVMAHEARELWGLTKYAALYTGHLHTRITRDLDGVQHQQASSPSGEDRWHEENGYTTSRKGIMGHLICFEDGPFCDFFASVSN